MYIVLRIYSKGQDNTCIVREMVMPCVLKREREIVGMARKITNRLLPRSVFCVDIYTREQVQDSQARLSSVTKAVGQLTKSGRSLVFKRA